MHDKPVDSETLTALYSQIEDICRQFREIRHEAASIVDNSQMPDAALHLHDVLQATEKATNIILDSATSIGALTDGGGVCAEAKGKITEEIGRIYEACSFQDISGQRIVRVLKHLSGLEEQLTRLSKSGPEHVAKPQAVTDELLNGPQLSSQAPSQQDIDLMFK